MVGFYACGASTDSVSGDSSRRAHPQNDTFHAMRGVVSQYRGEPAHQGIAPPGAWIPSKVPTLVWSSEVFGIGTYDASKSSPVVDRNRIYVGQDDGVLRALDRETGRILWAFETLRHYEERNKTDDQFTGIHGTPAFDDERVYVGDYSGVVYAVDRESGTFIWRNQLGGSIGSSPVLAEGYLWIAVEFPEPNGRIFKLEPNTGTVLGSSPYLGHHVHGTVSLSATRDNLYVGNNRGTFYLIDRTTLAIKSRILLEEPIKSTAALDDESVYVTAWDGALHAFAQSTLEPLFVVPTGARSMSSPAWQNDVVCFGSHDGILRCVARKTGASLWQSEPLGVIQSSPTMVGANVVVGSREGHLVAFRIEDGQKLWSYDLKSPITSVPVVVDGSIFVNDDSGTVHRLDASADEL
jgi:outer membrane protein assembly factor BamB